MPHLLLHLLFSTSSAVVLRAVAPHRSRPLVAQATSKGLTHVALVELGSGCCHGGNGTKAAVRACNSAIEWNSVKVRGPG